MKNLTYKQTGKLDKSWLLILRLFLLFGILIRLFHFFYNRSLWMDEVYLSASLVKYNYLQLISEPLLYQQKAPIGFLLAVKAMVNLFGNDNEFSLRLIPLLSGLLSLFVFIPVSRFFLSQRASVISIGIICFSPALVYHSVEIKQYSTELLGTLLCFYLYVKFEQTSKLKTLILWGLLGAVVLWFSYSSIFILTGIALGRSLSFIQNKNWRMLFAGLLPYSMWVISFLINYILFTHKHTESEWIVYWFRSYENFMPFPPKSLHELNWFFINFYRLIDYPLGLLWNFNAVSNKIISVALKMPIVPIGLLLGGIYTYNKEKKIFVWILISPILLTLLASGLELYPLTERFWVFLSPVFILIIAKAFDLAIFKTKSQLLHHSLAVLLLLAPIIQSFMFVANPATFYVHKKSFQRETLKLINDRYQKGDMVYIYWNNLPGYRLYKGMYNLKFEAIEGKDVRQQATNFNDYYKQLKPDLDQLTGSKRIWLVYNTKFLTDIGDGIDEPSWYYQKNLNPTEQLLKAFIQMGKPVDKIESNDVSVYLFDCNH